LDVDQIDKSTSDFCDSLRFGDVSGTDLHTGSCGIQSIVHLDIRDEIACKPVSPSYVLQPRLDCHRIVKMPSGPRS